MAVMQSKSNTLQLKQGRCSIASLRTRDDEACLDTVTEQEHTSTHEHSMKSLAGMFFNLHSLLRDLARNHIVTIRCNDVVVVDPSALGFA